MVNQDPDIVVGDNSIQTLDPGIIDALTWRVIMGSGGSGSCAPLAAPLRFP